MSESEFHTDQALFKELAKSSPHAYTIIFNQWFRSVYYFAARFVDPSDAEDIAVEVFQKLWAGKKMFQSTQNLKSFLFTSTRNACLDFIKTNHRRNGYEAAASRLMEEEENGFSEHEFMAELMKRVQEELGHLPPQTREVFSLAYFQGMTNAEIADRLNISDPTVRNQKSTALRVLRLALKYNFLFFM